MTANNTPNNALHDTLARRFNLNWETAIYIVILVFAVFTRFYILGDRVMSHDESLHTRFSYNLHQDGNFEHTPLMHGPILFHAVAFSYTIFGDNDFTSRIYTSFLGVLMVMSPLLFRRWLGRWGTILAMIMILCSPLLLYYHRYIRHDTPSIMSAILMMWAILMYINGPANQRRRAHWLYIIAAAMIWNLGSKETAFIYIAIFGIFLFLYWLVRLLQYFLRLPGRPIFHYGMIGILFGGVMSLGMYIILDVIKFDLFSGPDEISFFQLAAADQQTFFLWTFLCIALVLLVIIGTAFWAYRDKLHKLPWAQLAAVIGLALLVCFMLIIIEERSHTQPSGDNEPTAPVVPGDDVVGSAASALSTISWVPMIALWGVSLAGFAFLFITRRRAEDNDGDEKDKAGRGFWGTMDLFPEFDLIVVIGTLILPWATALVPYLMRPSPDDLTTVANSIPAVRDALLAVPQIGSLSQVGAFILGFLAWLPLIVLSTVVGLMWDWRRWLVAAAIFYVLFAFFFTTVFTNIAGLATGMIYSLGYWLEQQGVRRGSQPQYYYLLIIMPFYEFLPVIGGVLAMLAGSVFFWRRNRHDAEADRQLDNLQLDVRILEQEEAERLGVSPLEAAADDPDEHATQPTDDEPRPTPVFEDNPLLRVKREQVLRLQYERMERRRLDQIPFLIFFAWLAILNLVGYSLAGEKMPWLGTHLTLPLIFLTAWFFGRIIDRIDFEQFKQRGWLMLLVLPLLLIALGQTIGALLVANRPFAGLQQDQLEATYTWLATLAVSGGAMFVLWRQAQATGWAHLRQMLAVAFFAILAVLTFRSGWIASFIRYDEPTEFLVYAHAAPAIKTVLDDIEELSLRTTDGYEMRFAYDNSVSWPYSWYFRNYTNAVFVGENPTVQNLNDAVVVVVGDDKLSTVEPILADRYIRFDHKRLWWPMQDYFYLTPQRIYNTFDFSPDNTQAAQIRQGMFEMWWNRDYSTYGDALDKDFSLPNWPVSDTMLVYVRRDFAAQIWEYGVGDLDGVFVFEDEIVNACATNWLDVQAIDVLERADGSPLNRPLGMDVDSDGNLYVAEEGGNRISVFGPDGTLLRTLGQPNGGTGTGAFLNRPNSVHLSQGGDLYVADTWNYQIQLLDAVSGETIFNWGQPGEFSFDAPVEPTDGFWGPRDVATNGEGRIYVADTGNKRIRTYTRDSLESVNYVFDIGTGGSALGELDEPSAVSIHPEDGRVYIADYWNRRISVFDRSGVFLNTYPVRAWYEERGNRPYLDVDPERELLYVTDPDAGRILVYTTNGDCIGSFGQKTPDSGGAGLNNFSIAAGITVDDAGFVYVSDPGLSRVLKFTPFPLPEQAQEQDQQQGSEAQMQMPADEFDADVNLPIIELDDPNNPVIIQPERTAELDVLPLFGESSNAETTPEVGVAE